MEASQIQEVIPSQNMIEIEDLQSADDNDEDQSVLSPLTNNRSIEGNSQQSDLTSTTPTLSYDKSKRLKKLNKNSDASERLLHTINERFLQKANEKKEKDRFDVTGENVAIKLRLLPINQRIMAEKLINDVLYEAECNNLDKNWKVTNITNSSQAPNYNANFNANNRTNNDLSTSFATTRELFRQFNPESEI